MARIREERNVCKVLTGKLEGKKPNERQSRRCEDGIRLDLRDIGWGSGPSWLRIGSGCGLL
jgi:hypothetical protein